MAQVNVTISGRSYRMACDDGEEEHLGELADHLDRTIERLRGEFGEIGRTSARKLNGKSRRWRRRSPRWSENGIRASSAAAPMKPRLPGPSTLSPSASRRWPSD
jgi:hypothetical protein